MHLLNFQICVRECAGSVARAVVRVPSAARARERGDESTSEKVECASKTKAGKDREAKALLCVLCACVSVLPSDGDVPSSAS